MDLNAFGISFEMKPKVNKIIDSGSYSLVKLIGSGVYGQVYIGKRLEDGELCAVKVIRKETKGNLVEASLLTTIDHPFIVPCYRSYKAKRKQYIIMEYMRGGELYYHMKKRGYIPLNEAKIYVAEIALAIHHLHTMGIVYRDLKPENVMLGLDGHLKLTDFGLSVKGKVCYRVVGTPDYIAPELLQAKKCGKEVDWWALGVLFFEMLFKRTPFFAPNMEKMYEKIINRSAYVPDIDGNLDVPTFINGLLEKDPAYRFGFDDIVKHPLMSDVDFDAILRKEVTPAYIPDLFNPEDALYKRIKNEKIWLAHGVSYDSGEMTMEPEIHEIV